jgi:GDP-4-dehydro-6-deoxy-D-mannose reductase
MGGDPVRCLITGATGFVGRHLADALAAAGHDVIGLAKSGGPQDGSVPFPLYSIDLLDTAATEQALRTVDPEWVFHLAGFADTRESFEKPADAWTGNLTATQSLYTAVHRAKSRARILYVSSGLVYGDTGQDESGFSEDAPLRPDSPYAASKAAADLLSYQQTRHPGLDIVRVRPFNHIGPGQSKNYAVANFARQIAEAESGKGPPVVQTGNLTAERDFTDVRDIARAYIRLLEVGRAGEVYNVGSGRTHRMRDILGRLITLALVPVTVEEKLDAARANDTTIVRADTRKLRAATGWEPRYSLEQTLTDVLDDWRARV